jgi:peptidoglycan/LPS O-acetylase OafA/YrhL
MRKEELPALTGIRFYAALAVFLSHVTTLPGMETFSGKHTVFHLGDLGVSFFFVLSGFILTYNYADLFSAGVSATRYLKFVWDRLTKIYPVHFATTLLVLPMQLMSQTLPVDWRAIPIHLLLLQCFVPFSVPPFLKYLNVPSWSISCEWFFYLLAPFAMYCVFGKLRGPIIFVALAYLGALWLFLSGDQSEYSRVYFTSWFAPTRFIDFLVGIFVGWFFSTRITHGPLAGSAIAQTAGLLLLIAGVHYQRVTSWPILQGGLLFLPGSVLLAFGLAGGQGLLATHLNSNVLTKLGNASFSFYLLNMPILRIVKHTCNYFEYSVQSWTGFWVTIITMFILVQATAFAVYSRYEMPVQRALRRMVRRGPKIEALVS